VEGLERKLRQADIVQVRLFTGCQPGPPDERAGVAEFQQHQGSDGAAEEHTRVRQHLVVVAEIQH
jgi:hypothetical protein